MALESTAQSSQSGRPTHSQESLYTTLGLGCSAMRKLAFGTQGQMLGFLIEVDWLLGHFNF